MISAVFTEKAPLRRAVLFLAFLCAGLFLPASGGAAASSPPPETVYILSGLPGYYSAATAGQIRTLIGKHSLKGVATVKTINPGKKEEYYSSITPLMLAAKETASADVIRMLVAAGCDVNAEELWDTLPDQMKRFSYNWAPVHYAMDNPNPVALRTLLQCAKPPFGTPLERHWRRALEMAAERSDRAEHLQLLLAAGVRPDPASPREPLSLWKAFLGHDSYDDQLDSFHYAKKQRDTPESAAAKARILARYGLIPKGKDGAEALRHALIGGQYEVARLLLNAGVSPVWQDNKGRNMLHAALKRPKASHMSDAFVLPSVPPDILQRLLPGNDVNAREQYSGDSPLDMACKFGASGAAAKILVDAGAQYSTKNNSLVLAAVRSPHDCVDLVEYLLSLGFSAIDRGGEGEDPVVTTARVPRKPRCALALVKAGASPEGLMGVLDRDFIIKAGIVDAKGDLLVQPAPLSEREKQRKEAVRKKILAASRKDPKEAVYWRPLYAVATPDEVREIVGEQTFPRVRKTKREVSLMPAHGPGSLGMSLFWPVLIFNKEYRTGKRTVTDEATPLAVAARVTPYPEVIHMLVKAGCKADAIHSEAMHGAADNPNPEVFAAVLGYKPNLESALFYLGTPLQYLAATDPKEFKKEHFRLLLAAGANREATAGQDRNTPLMQAAFYRNTEAGRMLIAAGCNVNHVNRVGDTPLSKAVQSEAWDLALDILNAGGNPAGDSNRRSALISAADEDGVPPALVRALVKALGPESKEVERALCEAAKHGNLPMLKAMIESGVGKRRMLNEALWAAVTRKEKDNGPAVALLLTAGANPDVRSSDGFTPLANAAYFAMPKACAALLKAGADVNAVGDEGFLPIHNLSQWSLYTKKTRANVAKQLIAAGADVNRENEHGMTPLLLAINKPDLVALYLKAGANPNAVSSRGMTPLMHAVEKGEAEAVRLLLAAGANPAKPDGKGTFPVDFALEKKNGEAVAYLQAALLKKGAARQNRNR